MQITFGFICKYQVRTYNHFVGTTKHSVCNLQFGSIGVETLLMDHICVKNGKNYQCNSKYLNMYLIFFDGFNQVAYASGRYRFKGYIFDLLKNIIINFFQNAITWVISHPPYDPIPRHQNKCLGNRPNYMPM